MGDTQIQYSSLLAGHRRRHTCKQLGFRAVLLPEARKVTSRWKALGRRIGTSNATGPETVGNEGIYVSWDRACWSPAISRFRRKNICFPLQFLFCFIMLYDRNCNSCKSLRGHNFTPRKFGQIIFKVRMCSDLFCICVVFHQSVWLQTKDAITLFGACWWETPDFARGREITCATLSKAVNVLSHNSQARDLGVCLCGKALAGLGGTSIISVCLPGVACVEITAPINKQSPSVEIFIQTKLHPCGGLSEHSSCTLKGYSESHVWTRVHLEINGVPLTGWVLSATEVH